MKKQKVAVEVQAVQKFQEPIKDVAAYQYLRTMVQRSFDAVQKSFDFLFKVEDRDWYSLLLKEIKDPEQRQIYNCNACRKFFNDYAGLVRIDCDGVLRSAIFDFNPILIPDHTNNFFRKFVKAVQKALANSKIVSCFFLNKKREPSWRKR